METKHGAVISILVFLLIAGINFAGSVSSLEVGYEYESEVGAHFDNACSAQTPEQFIEEVDFALEGMDNLGLEPEMSARWFHWEQTPNHEVGWLISMLEATQDRARSIIDWRDHMFENDLMNEQIKDLYNDKMRHLRGSIKDNGEESMPLWIGADAYYHNFQPLYYWVWIWGTVLQVLTVLGGFIMVAYIYGAYEDHKEEQRRKNYDHGPGY